MIRGTTPTHMFTLPFSLELVDKIRIIYSQLGKVKIRKLETDCRLEGDTVTVKLNQEDTLAIKDSEVVDIQIRCQTKSGDAQASQVFHVAPGVCLENEVIQ